jgi:Cu-processing system permease protein
MLLYSYYDIEYALFERTAEDVLVHVAGYVIVSIGPLIALTLSFDSVTKEKSGKSLDLLLSRPLSKRAVAFGKFIGVITALTLPITILTLVDIFCISALLNWQFPSLNVFFGFILFTILLISTYALLQLIISTIAKTSGTAILSGIGLWLFFNMLWLLVIYAKYIISEPLEGIPSDPMLAIPILLKLGKFNNLMLFNPGGFWGGAYNLNIVMLAGSTPSGIPIWSPLASIIIWFVLSFIIAVEFFNRMADK